LFVEQKFGVYLYIANAFYLIVGIILIAVAGVGRSEGIVTTVSILGGIIAVGVFLICISWLGVAAVWKKKRGLIFLYMVLLILLFIIQFAVSIGVLAFNQSEQMTLLEDGWCGLSDNDKNQLQLRFNCYGGDTFVAADFPLNEPFRCTPGSLCPNAACAAVCAQNYNNSVSTTTVPLTTTSTATNNGATCQTCQRALLTQFSKALKAGGGVGLGFSFTEFIGIYCAYKLWKKDTGAGNTNYRAFL